jgi:arginyl-tRNA synthetase
MELGKLAEFSDEEKEDIFRKIGLGALKYFILKVDPRKNMTFNPEESIDFNGNTGPFIQYTYARIKSVLRKAAQAGLRDDIEVSFTFQPIPKETELIKLLRRFPDSVSAAATEYSPALLANYCYDLAREYNQFYHDYSILGESETAIRDFRLVLSRLTSEILATGMWLLGIGMPERM